MSNPTSPVRTPASPAKEAPRGTDQLAEAYEKSHPGSAAWYARARGYFPADGATHFARVRAPFRPYIARAQGSRKWDVDGNVYIDYVMGHGALVLGHGHPAVVEAVQAQAARGIHYGDNHGLEVDWAERIRALMPAAERIEYFASGQEANLMGLRVARAHTGRRRILKFKHNYHGWADELTGEGAAGAIADLVTVIPAGDLGLVEKELASGQYAAVLIEGGGSRVAGRIPIEPSLYQGLPELTRKYGAVLILDEVVTGFRESPGGWQAVVGITPDLTTVGKAASGGLPSGILLGRADILRVLSPESTVDRLVVHGGTWNAVPITCAAGIAACDQYRGGEPQRMAREAADALRRQGNAAFERLGAPARLFGRSVVHIYLGAIDRVPSDDTQPPTLDPAKLMDPKRTATYKRLDLHLLHRGVSVLRGEALIVSAAHTRADVEATAAALGESVKAMLDEGTLPPA